MECDIRAMSEKCCERSCCTVRKVKLRDTTILYYAMVFEKEWGSTLKMEKENVATRGLHVCFAEKRRRMNRSKDTIE